MTRSPDTDAPAVPESTGTSSRRSWVAVGVATVLAVLAAALLYHLLTPGDRTPLAGPDKGHHAPVTPKGYHLVVKSLDIDAPVVPIAMTSARVLTPPANPREVGWWDDSAEPGATGGQTIIAGHTVHTGGGQFDHLGTIKKGARIEIIRNRHTEEYVTTKVVTLSKQAVSEKAPSLFGQKRHPNRLVLITCGDWTGSEYLTNVFVYARPVGEVPI